MGAAPASHSPTDPRPRGPTHLAPASWYTTPDTSMDLPPQAPPFNPSARSCFAPPPAHFGFGSTKPRHPPTHPPPNPTPPLPRSSPLRALCCTRPPRCTRWWLAATRRRGVWAAPGCRQAPTRTWASHTTRARGTSRWGGGGGGGGGGAGGGGAGVFVGVCGGVYGGACGSCVRAGWAWVDCGRCGGSWVEGWVGGWVVG